MEQETPLQVVRMTAAASLPARASVGAAGYDIVASRAAQVPARGSCVINTDLALALPPGVYGRLAPRSGLALRASIDVGAGVIDPDYRGELLVLLFNHGDAPHSVSPGDRVAQLILERFATPDVHEVPELTETPRGAPAGRARALVAQHAVTAARPRR